MLYIPLSCIASIILFVINQIRENKKIKNKILSTIHFLSPDEAKRKLLDCSYKTYVLRKDFVTVPLNLPIDYNPLRIGLIIENNKVVDLRIG